MTGSTRQEVTRASQFGPIRILAVSAFGALHVGGAERYLHETLAGLRRRGLEVSQLHADDGNPEALSPPWRLFSGGYHPAWPRQVEQVLRDWRPDVIYAHFTVPGLVDVAVRRAQALGIPVCLVYHSDVTGPEWYRRLLGNMYYRLIGLRTLRGATALLVSSPEYWRASPWLSKLRGIRIDFAPPGVDEAIAMGCRQPGDPYLLFVGKSDVSSKGFDLLYQAWLRLRVGLPHLDLVAVGSVPRRAYPGVRFLGRIGARAKLADIYASALVTVLPSTSSAESFGMVLAEALVAGCPVVGSNIGGIPALISPGDNGYLFPPGDWIALAEVLARIIRENEMMRANIEKANFGERFGWETTIHRVFTSLETAANSPGSGNENPI